MPDQPPTEPTFKFIPATDEDGPELWWSHTCNFPDLVEDITGGTFRHAARLPMHLTRGWVVERAEPLTVSPSILCGSCKTHGFIRDGKWIAA